MRRLLAAAAGGILIPVIYTTVAVVAHVLVTDSPNVTMDWNAQPVPKLIFAPTMLPVYLVEFLREYDFAGLQPILDNPWFRVTFFFLFDFVLYSLITHTIFRKLGWLESRKSKTDTLG